MRRGAVNPTKRREANINYTTMSQDNLIKLECSQCRRINYHSKKNKKKLKNRLELMKFCKSCKARKMHKETK
jgi:large subunit ribosomal protein L33